MQTIAVFLFKSIITSGLFFGYYLLFLRNKRLYVYNRFYLLATVIISLLLPLQHFDWYQVQVQQKATSFTLLKAISSGGEEKIPTVNASHFSTENILYGVYAFISLAILAMLIVKITAIYRMKRRNKVIAMHGCHFINTENNSAPFSFFNNLFWRKSIPLDCEQGRQIFRHEMTHIQQQHTLDKLGMQLVLAFCWMNPIYWFIQKELSLVHEFIADEKAIEDNDTASFASMLLRSHYGNVFPDIIHPFFIHLLKGGLLCSPHQTKQIILTCAGCWYCLYWA